MATPPTAKLAAQCVVSPFNAFRCNTQRAAGQRHSAPIFARHRPGVTAQSTEQQDEGTRLLEEDMRRFQAREEANHAFDDISPGPSQQDGGNTGPKELLDKVLIADFFFVCIALAWLAGGVAESVGLNSTKLLDAWYPLWPAVFQPAIGVLMLGAVSICSLFLEVHNWWKAP